MGLASWIAGALAAFAVARLIPLGRGRRWGGELGAALVAGLAAGPAATALAFGGWSEPDLRAAGFAAALAFAAIPLLRLVRVRRQTKCNG